MRRPNACTGILLALLCTNSATAVEITAVLPSADGNQKVLPQQTNKINEVPKWAAKRMNPIPPSLASIQYGEKIFRLRCVACHGATLKGDGWVGGALDPGPADMNKRVPEHTDGQLAWRITEGLNGMPGWQKLILPEDIWHIVNYLRKATDSFKVDQRMLLTKKHNHHH